MLTKVPLTEEEITRLRTHLSVKSLIKYMNWAERILFLIPLLVLLAALIMILVSTDNLPLIAASFFLPAVFILIAVKEKIKIAWDVKKGQKYIREGVIKHKKIKQSWSRLTNSMSYCCMLRLDSDSKYFDLGNAERFPEYLYREGVTLRIEYVTNSQYIFSTTIVK
jgi:hypothetical protein